MKLTEKIAYLKGMLHGMELEPTTKEGKAVLQMAEIMEDMAVYIDDLQSQVDELTELCDLLDEDLGDVESDLYGDDEDDDDALKEEDEEDYHLGSVLPASYHRDDHDEYDDRYYDEEEETVQYIADCPNCHKTVTLSEPELAEGSMICPHCGELLEFNYNNIEAENVKSNEEEEPAEDVSDDGDADPQK